MMTIEERVATGAAWLDETLPDWWRQINLGILSLDDGCRCVLGQLAEPIAEHYGRTLRLRPDESGYAFATSAIAKHEHYNLAWSIGHGFLAGGSAAAESRVEYAALDEAWISLIKERFETS